jgi:tetratricopeptide (TPR) repeat protein
MRFPLRCCLPLMLVMAGAPAAAGTPEKKDPKAPAPPPVGIDQIKGIGPQEGWEQCPKCKTYHQPGYICCCPICGAQHPKNLKCRAEKAAPRREAACPVCDKRFVGPLPFRRNAEAGCDRDFCTHSLGQGVVNSVVWMCPRCGYANFCPVQDAGGEFNKKLGAEDAKAIRERVEPLFKKRVGEMAGKHAEVFEELDQSDIPDWLKFEMALEAAEARKAPSADKAKFALEGSYACRRALTSPVNMPSLGVVILASERAVEARGAVARNPRTVVKAITEIFAEASDAGEKKGAGKDAGEAAPKLSPGEAWYLHLRLAGAYDRLGEKTLALDNLDAAERVIKELKADPAQFKPFLTLVADHRKYLNKETALQARALACLRQALLVEKAYSGAAAVPSVYLLGELYRRQGDCVRAKTWLTLAGKLAVRDPFLAGWADEAMSLPGMRAAEPDDGEETTALALVEQLTGKKPVFETPKPGPKEPPGETPAAAPKSCAECMANIAKAYAAFVAKNGKAPADLQALVAGGFVSAEAAGGFKCPDTGTLYRFRSVKKATSADEMILFHADPRKSKCKKCLYADGTVKELD